MSEKLSCWSSDPMNRPFVVICIYMHVLIFSPSHAAETLQWVCHLFWQLQPVYVVLLHGSSASLYHLLLPPTDELAGPLSSFWNKFLQHLMSNLCKTPRAAFCQFVQWCKCLRVCYAAINRKIFFPLCSLCVTHLLGQGCPSHYCTTAWAGLEALVFLWCLGKPLQLLLILVRPFPCAEGGAGCWERGKQMFWSFEFKAADLSKQGKGKRKTGLTDDIWAKPEVCDKPESVSLHSFYRQASHFLSMRNCCMPPVTLQSPSFVPFLLLCARASPSASLLLACKGFLQTLLSNLFKQKVLLFLHTSIVHTRLSSAPLC